MLKQFLIIFLVFLGGILNSQSEFFFNSNFNPTGTGLPLNEVLSCTAVSGGFSEGDITTSDGLCTTATAFCFNAGGGLSYPNTSITNQYSINLFFKFSSLTGYSRIIDFSNSTADAGIYLLNNCLNFYPNGNIGTCPFFQPDLYYLFTFVRDGNSNLISIYVNGTLFGSYTDSGNLYRPASSSTPIIFFRDDNVVTCESKAGCIKYASISSELLTSTQVDSIWQNICDIAINECEATISYDQSSYSTGISSPQNVNITGNTSGIFSAEAGLTIDSSTGAITPSSSTPSLYTVTYTLDASCNNFSTTTTVNIQSSSQPSCDPSGNMLLFANYDGGILNINMDQNIPNVKIGVLSYEPVIIHITGTYASNVTQVIRAGFPDTNHDHCGQGVFSTSIDGPIPANYSNINYPPAALSNANGNPNIICAYSCDNDQYQGGCNTIDQVIDYFTTALGGTLYSLKVQYCCWNSSNTYSFSSLANQCCSSSVGTATINYTGSPYCSGSSQNPIPSIIGTSGGTFTSTNGLDIDPITGEIHLQTSSIGIYTVTYTLDGCPGFSTTTDIEIGNTTPAPTGISPQVLCQTATLNDIQVTGNSLQWYFDFTGQIPAPSTSGVTNQTHYYVSQTINGCESSLLDIQVQFPLPGHLNVSPQGPVDVCNGEYILFTAEDGYNQYYWSNSGNGQTQYIGTSGTYSVSTYDANGCLLLSDPIVVTQIPPFTIAISPPNPTACVGDPITLTAESGYQNYIWSNSINGQSITINSGGFYSVSAEDIHGCTGTSDAISVQFIQPPSSVFTYSEGIALYEIQFNVSTIADTYSWDFGDGFTNLGSSPSHIFPYDATWPVSLIVENGCGSDTSTMDVVVIKSGIHDLTQLNNLSISPNPGIDYLVINGNSEKPRNVTIQILSIDGKLLNANQYSIDGKFKIGINTEKLSSGFYFIRLSDSDSFISMPWIKMRN